MLAAVPLLAALAGPAQEPLTDPAPEEERAQLAERVESLRCFTLLYSLFPPGGEPKRMRLAYAAPDRALLEFGDGEDRARTWFVGGVMATLIEAEGRTQWGRADFRGAFEECADVRAALFGSFPELGSLAPRPPEPELHVDLEPSGFSILLGARTDRPAFFCWNGTHRDRFASVRLDPGHVVLEAGGESRLEIARWESAGFLELAFAEAEKGRFLLRRDGVELSSDERDFALPERPEGAEDLSEGLERIAQDQFGPWAVRRDLHRAIVALLDRGAIEWTDATRARLAGVLETLHRHWIPSSYADWMAGIASTIERIADTARREREGPEADLERVRAEVLKLRAKIEASLAEIDQAYSARLEPYAEAPRSADLLGLEREVGRKLFDLTVRKPALERFDREVGALLAE